jgi:hypothetical protein
MGNFFRYLKLSKEINSSLVVAAIIFNKYVHT